MNAVESYAQHGSWRCWLSWADRQGPALELVWQISGMVPRVLLQIGRVGDGDAHEQEARRRTDEAIVGPSGHVYQPGLSQGLSDVVDCVLRDLSEAEGPNMQLIQAGSEIDTSEIVLRRALDLVRHLIDSAPETLTSERLHKLLHDRSRDWASW